MEFSNLQLTPNELPHVEDIDLHPVSPLYNKVQVYRWLVFWATVFLVWIGVAIFFREKFPTLIIAMVSVGIVFLATIFRLLFYWSYKNRGYAIRQHDLIAQSGWWIKELQVCPINRIQHTTLSADVFERRLGLATLTLYTAGNNDSDLSLPGLTEEKAKQLKEFIGQYNLPAVASS